MEIWQDNTFTLTHTPALQADTDLTYHDGDNFTHISSYTFTNSSIKRACTWMAVALDASMNMGLKGLFLILESFTWAIKSFASSSIYFLQILVEAYII